MKKKPNYLYRIYYGDMLMYVGRTHQALARRLHGHFFGAPMHRKLDLELVTKIEFAECQSEADMYLYEIYYINKDAFKPPCNCDDRARDELTVELPELGWREFDVVLAEDWKRQIRERDARFEEKKRMAEEAFLKMQEVGYEVRGTPLEDNEEGWKRYEAARDEWERLTKEAKVW